MAGRKKPAFDQEAAFKSIIGAGQEDTIQTQDPPKESRGKGRPKTAGETKKRITLAMYPSIYENLQKIAFVKRKSISGIVEELASSYIAENTGTLDEYDRIQKD